MVAFSITTVLYGKSINSGGLSSASMISILTTVPLDNIGCPPSNASTVTSIFSYTSLSNALSMIIAPEFSMSNKPDCDKSEYARVYVICPFAPTSASVALITMIVVPILAFSVISVEYPSGCEKTGRLSLTSPTVISSDTEAVDGGTPLSITDTIKSKEAFNSRSNAFSKVTSPVVTLISKNPSEFDKLYLSSASWSGSIATTVVTIVPSFSSSSTLTPVIPLVKTGFWFISVTITVNDKEDSLTGVPRSLAVTVNE